MYTLEKYYSNAILISNSLVLKIPEIGFAMNKGIFVRTGKVTDKNKKNWKYYKNLAGIKHESNKDIYITYLETNERGLLTKEMLNKHPKTKSVLLKFGDKFKELCEEYPGESVYIRGCLYDIDIVEAIAAKPGTILAYNKEFIEENEYSLIKDLQEYIYNFFSRWHVREYVLTDELYLPVLLGVLFSALPNKIMNIRNKYSLTAEAHIFHLEHFFRSRMDIWEEVSVMNKESQFWLYKNMDWMMKHVGKGGTFNKMIWKLLEANRIGIASYTLDVPDFNEKLLNNLNYLDTSYRKANSTFLTNKLNNSYAIDDRTSLDLSYLIQREIGEVGNLETSHATGRDDYEVRIEEEKLNNSRTINQKTKALDLNTVRLFQSSAVDPFHIAFDYWAYLSYTKDIFAFKVNYRDNNVDKGVSDKLQNGNNSTGLEVLAGKTYYVTPKVGLLMLLKVLLKASGNLDKKLTTLNLNSILNTDAEYLESIIPGLWDDGSSVNLIKTMIKKIPQEPFIIRDVPETMEYLESILDYHLQNWHLDVNCENLIGHANYVVFNERTLKPVTVTLTNVPKTIDELLADEGVDYVIPDTFDLNVSFAGLFSTFFGFDISKTEATLDLLRKYVSLVDKLTSYTTQVVTSTSIDEEETLEYNHIAVLKSSKPLLLITDSSLHPIEHTRPIIRSNASDFMDYPDFISNPIPDTMVWPCKWPIKGHMIETRITEKDTFANYYNGPNMLIDVIDVPNRDISGCPFKNMFLTITGARFHQLEHWFKNAEVRGAALTITEALDTYTMNQPLAISIPIPETMVFTHDKKAVKGHMVVTEIKDEKSLFVNYNLFPQFMADVINQPNFDLSTSFLKDDFLRIQKARFNALEKYSYDDEDKMIISSRGIATGFIDSPDFVSSQFVANFHNLTPVDNPTRNMSFVANNYRWNDMEDYAPLSNVFKLSLGNEEVEFRKEADIEAEYMSPIITAVDADADTYLDDSADVTIVENPEGGYMSLNKPEVVEDGEVLHSEENK